MRSDGFIERWNELPSHVRGNWDGDVSRPQRHAGFADLSDFWRFLSLAWIEHQSWFYVLPGTQNTILFPFAFRKALRKGDKIQNLTSHVDYTVEAVDRFNINLPRTAEPKSCYGVVVSGGPMPNSTDRLRFPWENYIEIRPDRAPSTESTAGETVSTSLNPGAFNEVVTYRLIRREPGSVDGRVFGRHQERVPRHRENLDNRPDDVSTIEFRSHRFDNEVQFQCYAKTPDEADILVEYFEEFMALWYPVFQYNGVLHILYGRRGEDTIDVRYKTDLQVRTLRYDVLTEKVIHTVGSLLRTLEVAVRIGATDSLTPAEQKFDRYQIDVQESSQN